MFTGRLTLTIRRNAPSTVPATRRRQPAIGSTPAGMVVERTSRRTPRSHDGQQFAAFCVNPAKMAMILAIVD
jgi:hypothetical protein